jgi:hypothetical protein
MKMQKPELKLLHVSKSGMNRKQYDVDVNLLVQEGGIKDGNDVRNSIGTRIAHWDTKHSLHSGWIDYFKMVELS